jgi:hypothetical protein
MAPNFAGSSQINKRVFLQPGLRTYITTLVILSSPLFRGHLSPRLP